MKITLYEEAPKCLKCKKPMKFERCLERISCGDLEFYAELYRCPKCLNLYKVE